MPEPPEKHPGHEGYNLHKLTVPEMAEWAPEDAGFKEITRMRKLHALEMRAQGASYLEIAEDLQVSEKRAKSIIQTAVREATEEPVGEIRHQEHFRLERLMGVVWPRAMRGDGFAVDRVLRIMERKAKLLGLDAPAEIDIRSIRVELFTLLRDSLDPETYQKVLEAAER